MTTARKFTSEALKRATAASREFRDGIESLRARIAALKSEREQVENLPPTQDIALQRVDDWIENLAFTARDRTPDPRRFVAGLNYYQPYGLDRDAVLFAYLTPALADAAKARVLDLYANGMAGVSEDERRNQLDRIDRELLDSELAEESLLRGAEQAGFAIQRRADQDPRAALASEEALP